MDVQMKNLRGLAADGTSARRDARRRTGDG